MSSSDRLLSVLTLFTVDQPEWTAEAAAKELGVTISTAYRYFKSLASAGLIVAYASGRYILGPAFIQYDRQIRLIDPLITSARPVMTRIASLMPPKTLMILCRLYRTQVMCVHQEFHQRPNFASSYERGRPMPLYKGAPSKIILANMPLRSVKSLYERNAQEIREAGLGVDWAQVIQSLRVMRSNGYAITAGELDPGVQGIAVPIFSPQKAIIGCLCSVMQDVKGKTPATPPLKAMDYLLTGAREIEAALSSLGIWSNPTNKIAQDQNPSHAKKMRKAI